MMIATAKRVGEADVGPASVSDSVIPLTRALYLPLLAALTHSSLNAAADFLHSHRYA